MKDLALHLLDVLENSAKVGAPCVSVCFSWQDSWLHVAICDNGPGFPAGISADPANPYSTTRTERNIGLGLGLLRRAAEDTGGRLAIESRPGEGVSLFLDINMAHIDARPLGDLVATFSTAAMAWPETSLTVELADCEPCLDMNEVHKMLDGVLPSHPSVRKFLENCLSEGLAPLVEWAGRIELETGPVGTGPPVKPE